MKPARSGTFYRRTGKRLFDLVLAGPALLLLAPLLAVLAVIVRLRLGAPVLFRQLRPGLHGHPFTIYKLRTMNDARDGEGRLLPDGDRLTPLGQFLRRTSLDELPELFNVLHGDMSIVGPRPLLMHYLERYTPEQMRRHEVRPGITGWAQANGRNNLTWDEKFNLDVWYVDHVSLLLDVRIILLTIRLILRREGISHPGQATMHEFRGQPEGLMRVIILGAGGHGQVVADILMRMADAGKDVTPVGYLDDALGLQGRTFLGLPVLGPLKDPVLLECEGVIVAIGNNIIRRRIFSDLPTGLALISAFHPRDGSA